MTLQYIFIYIVSQIILTITMHSPQKKKKLSPSIYKLRKDYIFFPMMLSIIQLNSF